MICKKIIYAKSDQFTHSQSPTYSEDTSSYTHIEQDILINLSLINKFAVDLL